MSEKKWRRGRVRKRGRKVLPTLSLLLSSTFVFLRSPFRATVHYPLSTVHYAWNRLVHSGLESFFQCRCKGSIDVHLGAFGILKAHTHAAAIPAGLALVKRHFFSIFRFAVYFGYLFLTMVLHRRLKRVKVFSEMFVTKYLYKRDSNTLKRTCIMCTYT